MCEELKLIKKYYGERMMYFCRKEFSTILEKEGLLIQILLKKFEPNKSLLDDLITQNRITDFINFIYSLVNFSKKRKSEVTNPFELLEQAGYTLYECNTKDDIDKFKNYYIKKEEICTFREDRLKDCYVFFAVKNNVDDIKRQEKPRRDDVYGVSVISIQFKRGKYNIVSIKNRYNHTVPNADATYSNNLDNIIPGLTNSFETYYNFKIYSDMSNFELDNYIKANDGKYYKYNIEIGTTYYCPNNLIIEDGVVNRDYQQMERYILMDYFILDLQEKTISLHEDISDDFVSHFSDIKTINVSRNSLNSEKEIHIFSNGKEPIYILLDKHYNIIEYKNRNIKLIGNNFLARNRKMREIYLDNVYKISNNFLYYNEELEKVSFCKLKVIKDNFLPYNKMASSIFLPEIQEIGENFMYFNLKIKTNEKNKALTKKI